MNWMDGWMDGLIGRWRFRGAFVALPYKKSEISNSFCSQTGGELGNFITPPDRSGPQLSIESKNWLLAPGEVF